MYAFRFPTWLHPTLFSVGPFDVFGHSVGPLSIRWYALAYISSLLLGWRIVRHLVRRSPAVATVEQTDDFLTWATLGVVVGGRLGYVLIYQFIFDPSAVLNNPLSILAVWNGGMSFHGGAVGVTVALILFCRHQKIPLLGFADRIAIVTPLGLGIGRLANFVNGELWGRPAPDWVPFRMIFPSAPDDLPRYPSQLYQSFMEGLVLFTILWVLGRREAVRERFGVLTGVFLAGYAVARTLGELVRQPDDLPLNHGFLIEGATMGQLLSLPMLIAGLWLIARARPRAVALVA